MNPLEQLVNKELEHVPVRTLNSLGRYHLVNPQGQIYSRFTGWSEPDGKLFGHQFHKSEAIVVHDLLKIHGTDDARIEKDKTGTVFIWVMTLLGPFAKPHVVASMMFCLLIFFVALFIMQATNAPERFLEYLVK